MEGAGVNSLLIYASQITARVAYIVGELFPPAELIDSKEKFIAHHGVKICYSPEKFCSNTLWVVPFGLLQEDGIHEQKVNISEWKNRKIFFATSGDIPFDIFSASFYLLSRYEEYMPHELDEYGRYSHTNSIAYKNNFLREPLVNEWMQLLEVQLKERCSNSRFSIQQSTFKFTPTYDIDEAFSYLHKPLWKNILGFFRDFLLGKFEQVVERGNVYSGRRPDPFDTFEWIDALHEKYQLKPIYFFLTIIKRGVYDKNISAGKKALKQLYERLSAKYSSGLHPSWQSGTEEWLLQKELEKLQDIIHCPVTMSRNHYLRFTIPHTYRRLLTAGITDDYSMAYGNVNGFRASYALPYHWYDIEKEIVTDLVIHPFCFMEATSFFNQGYSVEQAADEIQYYYTIVKKVNGEFITLFHNHFLTEQLQWIQWREMYASFLKKNFSRQ
ncbi:MAG: polysaccharide deacetylase family protein [Sediminibacterium sp.]